MITTQYDDIVPESYFIEYKTATPQRKGEILNKVFSLVRGVNTFPVKDMDFDDEIQTLRTLAKLSANDLYDEPVIKSNNAGLTLLDKYYPNIFDVRKSYNWTNQPISLTTREGFYSDKHLRQALRGLLESESNIKGLRSFLKLTKIGYCNNFKPAVAKVIYDTNLKPNSKVYDYALGYGGRLLGAWAADHVMEYVGVDPNTETFNNAINFDKFLNKSYPNLDNVVLMPIGSEDFSIVNYPQYENYFDMAFSSPQYYDVELYCDEPTQSFNKFPDYKDWVKGFLRPTIHNAIDVLKPEGIFAINISENTERVLRNINSVIEFLCAEKGFHKYKIDKMQIMVRPGNGERDRSKKKYEPVWYFQKK